ncbi:hypothetical protein PHB09_024 [Pseudomonas phage PHB09]|uniref:Uncharacterized protein n=1 Tax=Pseudomonas phage PHB09 TaxID=2867265 RepID=A0AAE8XCR1_9CAUD|nr:hypothetical protein QGX10_gp024 [Pseudomonas phage PHB09]UAV84520.1 hypothetical protein PHB09_024 [Pseudomonas phage PHB09]
MTDFIDVVEHSPITFVKKVAEAIAEGYRVENTIPGYPHFGSYGNLIRLFKADGPSGVMIAAEFSGKVEHYDPMEFMLLLQSYALAGYTFKDGGDHFFDEKGLKSIELELVKEESAKEKTPAKKPVQKKALKAEETKEELEGKE